MKKFVTALLLLNIAFSTYVVINSLDWRDVYAGLLYASLKGYRAVFLTSAVSADWISKALPKNEKIIVIEGSKPFFRNYANYLLKFEGFSDVENIYSSNPTDLFLKFLFEIRPEKVALVYENEPENAVIAGPFAFRERWWVIVYSKGEESKVIDAIKSSGVKRVYAIGSQTLAMEDLLKTFPGEVVIINEGGPYSNSLKLAELWKRSYDSRYAVLGTGTYLDYTLVSGNNGKGPVLLVGPANLREIIDFLLKNNFTLVEVIGPQLAGVAYRIREESGKRIGVFLKFGFGFTRLQQLSGKVYALPTFEIPIAEPILNITRVIYDPSIKRLLLVYENLGKSQVYAISSIQIQAGDTIVDAVGDESPVFLDVGDKRVVFYPVNLDEYLNQNLTARITCKYGRYLDYLSKYVLDPGQSFPPLIRPIEVTKLSDKSQVVVLGLKYSKEGFFVEVKNVGKTGVYVDAYISFKEGGAERKIGAKKMIFLKPGEKGVLEVPYRFEKDPKEENEEVMVVLMYGENPSLLINVLALSLEPKAMLQIPPLAIILLVLLLLIFILLRLGKGGRKKVGKKRKRRRTKS